MKTVVRASGAVKRPGTKALPKEPGEDRVVYWHVIVIACLAFAVFAGTLYAGFVWDDKMQIVRNPALKDLHAWPRFFTTGVWGLLYSHLANNYYRPLMYVTYSAIYHLFGLHAGIFHLVNTTLHTLVAVMVYLLTLRLFHSSRMALIAGLIFAVHPIHTEAVAWLAAIPELIFTFLYLLAFYFYLEAKEARGPGWPWRIASLLTFFAALLSKEMAFTFPLVLMTYEWMYLRKRFMDGLRSVAWYFIPAAVCLAMRFHALEGFAPLYRFSEMTASELVLSVIALVGQYWWKLVVPVRLNAFYMFEPSRSLLEPRVALALLTEAGLGCVMWRLWRSGNRQWFSIAWVFVTLLPVLYVNGVGLNVFAERYLYLPSLGFCWLVAYLLMKVKRRSLATGLTVALAALLSFRTVARAAVWNNEFVLFTDTLEGSPTAFVIQNEMGVALGEKGRVDEAREHFAAAIRIKWDYGDAHENLAGVYFARGSYDDAIAEYWKALQVKPEDAVLRNLLGYALYLKGQTDLAIEQLNEAIRLKPELFEPYNNLGLIYSQRGAVEQAIQCYRKCTALRPTAEAYNNLGALYVQRGLVDEALREFGEAARLEPGRAEAHYNLGKLYAHKGQFDRAIEEYRKVVSIDPGDTEARASLQAAMERKER
jgi:tetratricopeptide (TPR) repeat protein